MIIVPTSQVDKLITTKLAACAGETYLPPASSLATVPLTAYCQPGMGVQGHLLCDSGVLLSRLAI